MGLLASCAKEAQEPVVEAVPETTVSQTFIKVGITPETKTYMGAAVDGKHKVYWSNGDKIRINGIESAALDGLAEDTQVATFSFASDPATPYNVLYPASIWKDATHVTLPDFQEYKANNFADGMNPMAGYSLDGTSITVNHLCAIMKVSVLRAAVDADADDLVAVRFKGRNNEQVKGDFTIDFENATLAGASDAEEDKEVKVVHAAVTATDTPVSFYVVVPAGTYSNGFDITVQDGKGHFMKKSKTASVTLVAGKLYNMTEFAFVPDASAATDLEISTVEELIAFAEAYNNHAFDEYDSALSVKLTADLTFDATSSAAYNATGGIGLKSGFGDAEDFYFNGIIDGNNHKIHGFAATVPLVKASGEYGVVKNLTIEDDCSFTFTHPSTGEFDLGSVVGYHKGLLDNVTVKADVAMAAGEIEKVTALGGLVGRVTVGMVKDCSYSGNLAVPEDFETSQKTYVGGLVGSMTNAAGIVRNSDFEGTIDFAGTVSSTDKTNPYLMLGGIVGSVNAGTVSGCEAKGTNTKEITMDNDKSYSATIQNHSRLAYHLVQGGIAGMNAGTVSDCTNGASIKNFVLTTGEKGGSASDSNSRYYDLGGIVGLNAAGATVTDCVNNVDMESRSTPRIQKIGGVVGYNKGTVSSSSNTEFGTIYISTTNITPYSLRVGEVGGIIGNNEGTVSNVSNEGDIRMDRTENAAGVELKFGGVIGLTTAAINGGDGKNISNAGNIIDSYNGTTVTTAGLRFGGVVGSAQASVQNVTNEGKVSYQTSSTNVVSKLYMGGIAGEIRSTASAVVSGCVNQGEVYFNVANNAAHTDNYVGGILGYTFESNVAISNCTNEGYIHGGNPSKQNGKTMYVGGIVAYLSNNEGTSSIANCENNGVLLNNQFNNNNSKTGSTFEGGIAGFVLGTADNRITITDVTNDVDNDGDPITGGRRGFIGGAVGYGEYVDITNAENTNSYGGGSGYWYGGIAGWIVSSTITNSTYTGTSIESSQIQGAGGIVCVLDADSTLDGCSSYLNSITPGANACVNGAVAAKSVAGSTIKNCHYKDVYAICSDSNFTDAGGNVADL